MHSNQKSEEERTGKIWSEDFVAYFKGLSEELLERLGESTGRIQSA